MTSGPRPSGEQEAGPCLGAEMYLDLFGLKLTNAEIDLFLARIANVSQKRTPASCGPILTDGLVLSTRRAV